MEKQRTIIGPKRFSLTIERLCHQLVEEFDDFSNTYIIGIQPRGLAPSERIYRHLIDQLNIQHIDYCKLDISFYLLILVKARPDMRIYTKEEKPDDL